MKVLAAMSGGVDSAVAAARAVDAGHEVVGVHMALSKNRDQTRTGSRGCCTVEDASDARRAADRIGIPYYVWDLSDDFHDLVVEDFLSEYAAGRTPNPCVRCNERIKFASLLERATALGFDAVCTGHYATIRTDGPGGAPSLHRSRNMAKDQSYVLAVMGPEAVGRSLFPLGEYATKDEVRAEAQARGLGVSTKPDSYDICFVADGDTRGFLERNLGEAPGEILDDSGTVLGTHRGTHGFTIGQRKGLGIQHPAPDGAPRYVVDIDPSSRQVVIGAGELLSTRELRATEVISFEPLEAGREVHAQIRAHGEATPATILEVPATAGADGFPRRRQPASRAQHPDPRRRTRADPRPLRRGQGPRRRHPGAPLMKPLVTLTGDGTFRAPTPQEALALDLPDDPHLAALMRLRALLGDDLEEQIATRLYLPSALGLDETDHLLPSTLALLAETTGDLVSYGWRLGTGTGLAWQHARELRERMLDAARIALLGYEGALMTTALGPATLAGATFLQSGERTLGDPGAVRDLPMLLAEGLVGHLADPAGPGPWSTAARAAARGRGGRRARGTHPHPVRAAPLRTDPRPRDRGALAQSLFVALEDFGLGADSVTLGVGADIELLRAARDAGARRMAISPRRLPPLTSPQGRVLWEGIAEAADQGCVFELVVDPRPGGLLGPELEMMFESWRRLGHSDAEAAGVAVIAHTGASHAVHSGLVDPSAQPSASTLLDESALEALLRIAPSWAERLVD